MKHGTDKLSILGLATLLSLLAPLTSRADEVGAAVVAGGVKFDQGKKESAEGTTETGFIGGGMTIRGEGVLVNGNGAIVAAEAEFDTSGSGEIDTNKTQVDLGPRLKLRIGTEYVANLLATGDMGTRAVPADPEDEEPTLTGCTTAPWLVLGIASPVSIKMKKVGPENEHKVESKTEPTLKGETGYGYGLVCRLGNTAVVFGAEALAAGEASFTPDVSIGGRLFAGVGYQSMMDSVSVIAQGEHLQAISARHTREMETRLRVGVAITPGAGDGTSAGGLYISAQVSDESNKNEHVPGWDNVQKYQLVVGGAGVAPIAN